MKYILFTESTDYESHVCVFDFIKGTWYFISPFSVQLNMVIYPVSEKVLFKLLETHEHYCIPDGQIPHSRFAIGSKLVLSCIGVVKFYIGLKNPFIFTPKHLRLYLQGNKISLGQKVMRIGEAIKMYTIISWGRLDSFYGEFTQAIAVLCR